MDAMFSQAQKDAVMSTAVHGQKEIAVINIWRMHPEMPASFGNSLANFQKMLEGVPADNVIALSRSKQGEQVLIEHAKAKYQLFTEAEKCSAMGVPSDKVYPVYDDAMRRLEAVFKEEYKIAMSPLYAKSIGKTSGSDRIAQAYGTVVNDYVGENKPLTKLAAPEAAPATTTAQQPAETPQAPAPETKQAPPVVTKAVEVTLEQVRKQLGAADVDLSAKLPTLAEVEAGQKRVDDTVNTKTEQDPQKWETLVASPEFSALWNRMSALTDDVLQKMVDAKLISPEQRDALKQLRDDMGELVKLVEERKNAYARIEELDKKGGLTLEEQKELEELRRHVKKDIEPRINELTMSEPGERIPGTTRYANLIGADTGKLAAKDESGVAMIDAAGTKMAGEGEKAAFAESAYSVASGQKYDLVISEEQYDLLSEEGRMPPNTRAEIQRAPDGTVTYHLLNAPMDDYIMANIPNDQRDAAIETMRNAGDVASGQKYDLVISKEQYDLLTAEGMAPPNTRAEIQRAPDGTVTYHLLNAPMDDYIMANIPNDQRDAAIKRLQNASPQQLADLQKAINEKGDVGAAFAAIPAPATEKAEGGGAGGEGTGAEAGGESSGGGAGGPGV